MQIAAVILAAGASTRFGSPKQLARIGRRTMLEAVAASAHGAGLHPVIAVVPANMPVPADIVPVINDTPSEGLSRSLRLGLAAVPTEADAAVVLLGDQPTLARNMIRAVVSEARGDRAVVAASADGRIGPPVLLMRDAFALADDARGDEGLRSILVDHPELLTMIEIGEHAPDVDTPGDLATLGEACPGCGALFKSEPDGATHAYIGASASCWAAFSELIAREFQDPSYGSVHRHTVDAYTVQHPGADDRRQRQSVAIHLIGLCHWLEHGMSASELNPMTQALASEKREWPWLEPPRAYSVTVLDVLKAKGGDEHTDLVRDWAASVWEAWAEHHAVVREWAADALRQRR